MTGFLILLAALAFLSGFGILSSAQSAIHEIEAFVLIVASAVLFSGAAVVNAVNSLKRDIRALGASSGKTAAAENEAGRHAA